jgi:hypothetical protein
MAPSATTINENLEGLAICCAEASQLLSREKAGLRRDAAGSQVTDVLEAQEKEKAGVFSATINAEDAPVIAVYRGNGAEPSEKESTRRGLFESLFRIVISGRQLESLSQTEPPPS